MARVARPAALLAAVAALGAATGCSGDGGGDPEAFCGAVRARRAALFAAPPPPGTEAARAHVAAYVELAELAPGDIRGDVAELSDLYERYATLDMGSDEAVGDFYVDASDDDVRAASDEVTSYVRERCGVEPSPEA